MFGAEVLMSGPTDLAFGNSVPVKDLAFTGITADHPSERARYILIGFQVHGTSMTFSR